MESGSALPLNRKQNPAKRRRREATVALCKPAMPASLEELADITRSASGMLNKRPRHKARALEKTAVAAVREVLMELDIEARMAQLEEAHRSLAAQHMGLLATCRAMLPLIAATPDKIQQCLLLAYDSQVDTMEQSGMDGDFQAQTCSAMDKLASLIVEIARAPS